MESRITPAAIFTIDKAPPPVETKSSHYSFFSESKITFKQKLWSAVRHTLYVCVIGASNKSKDIKKTAGWVYNLDLHSKSVGKYHNALEYKPDPKCSTANFAYCKKTKRLVTTKYAWYYQWDKDQPKFLLCPRRIGELPEAGSADALETKTNRSHFVLLALAAHSLETRYGNCHNRCCVIAKYLWEHNAGIKRIEIASTVNFEHYIVIVNRKDDSDLNDPESWGDAWVIDAWYKKKGMVFPASEYKTQIKKIKDYVKWELEQCAKLGMEFKPVKESESEPLEIDDSCFKEIRPQIDKYPTLSLDPFFPLEYYYFVSLNTPKFILDEIKQSTTKGLFRCKARKAHQELFSQCMSELQEVRKNKLG